MYEIYKLDLEQTGLVVLSACQTQMGAVSHGDEIVGLNRAFLYQTPTVMATLWQVDDEATSRLMENFYKNLREGHGKAQALALAQEMLRTDPEHPQWRHPYYWAAFLLNGDPGLEAGPDAEPSAKRFPDIILPMSLIVLLLAISLVLAAAVRRRKRRLPRGT